jgi:hypothetical protein
MAVSDRSSEHLTVRERTAVKAFCYRLDERFPGEMLQVTLFGSKARGESDRWSDIDLLIFVREESWSLRGDISIIGADISLEFSVLIGPRVIGQQRWQRMKEQRFSLCQNIIAEGVPLSSAWVRG